MFPVTFPVDNILFNCDENYIIAQIVEKEDLDGYKDVKYLTFFDPNQGNKHVEMKNKVDIPNFTDMFYDDGQTIHGK